jgi:hypothetical protein
MLRNKMGNQSNKNEDKKLAINVNDCFLIRHSWNSLITKRGLKPLGKFNFILFI